MHLSAKCLGQHLFPLRVFVMVMEDDTEALLDEFELPGMGE